MSHVYETTPPYFIPSIQKDVGTPKKLRTKPRLLQQVHRAILTGCKICPSELLRLGSSRWISLVKARAAVRIDGRFTAYYRTIFIRYECEYFHVPHLDRMLDLTPLVST
jgi:hypothetical protein